MPSSPKTTVVERLARAHYEAVNMRIHGSVWPTWDQQTQERRDWFISDMREALATVPGLWLVPQDGNIREARASDT